MRYNYQTKGVCSRTISFDIEDGIISNVKFDGGCNGNLKAISRLVDGKKAEEIFGGIDACKLRSSMTLFDAVCPNDVFAKVLDVFFSGVRDSRTLNLIKG